MLIVKQRKPGQTIVGFLILLSLFFFSANFSGCAWGRTHATWAWPGQQFNVFHNGNWYDCSVGFPAWDSAGNHYFITAGHCFRSNDAITHYLYNQEHNMGLPIYSPEDLHHAVGYEKIYMQPVGDNILDISLVEMYPGGKIHGHGWQNVPDIPVSARLGQNACLAGHRHRDLTCGKVTRTHMNIVAAGNYLGNPNLTETSYCALEGDSGGAVFNNSGALGINVAGDQHCVSAYIPIADALQAIRTQIPTITI